MAISNFNRIIDLEFSADKEGHGFKVTCPRSGRKPDIEISGTLLPDDNMQTFTVRVKNLYTSKILTEFHYIHVTCGYETAPALTFEGAVTNVYTSSPGPDRETVITVTAGSYMDWMDVCGDYTFQESTPLIDILERLSDDLGFIAPNGSSDALSMTASTPLIFTGSARECVHKLRQLFPDVNITVRNGGFVATTKEITTDKIFFIPYLNSPPQISGNQYTITAPFDPAIRPDDTVRINTAFSTKTMDTAGNDSGTSGSGEEVNIRVASITFRFGTIDGNEMTIVGVV